MKILLIDDDRNSLNTFQEVLILHGIECLAYQNPLEGLEQFSHEHFDLVILDYMMPEMNGIDVMTEILKLDKQAKIILYTGQSDSRIEADARRIGAFDFFFKPIDWNHLMTLIVKMSN
jgi:putative two-component system response regulator